MTRTLDGNPIPAAVNGSSRVGGVQDGVDATFTPALLYGPALNRALHTGTQPISSVALLQAALDGKPPWNVIWRSAGFEVGVPGGVDDTVIVQNARLAAGVGGSVIFGPGTYVVSGLAASVANQHWIVQPGAVIKTKNGANTPAIDVTASGVTIDGGGTIDGNKTNQTLTSIGDSTGGPTAGIRIIGVDRCTVENLSITNCGHHAVYVSNSTGDKILGNRVTNCGMAANFKTVFLYDYYGVVTDVEIAGNTIDGTGPNNGCIAVAMYTTVCSGVRIHHNRLLVGNGGATPTLGIELFTSELSPGAGGSIRDLTITGNVIRGEASPASTDQMYGISIGGVSPTEGHGDTNIVVSGNTIRDCPSHSIEIIGSGVSVTGNTLVDSGQIAVYATEVEGGIFGVSITGNTVRRSTNASYAIVLDGDTNGIFGLVIADNSFTDPAGVFVATAGTITGLTLRGNTVTGLLSHAVVIQGTVTDSSIAGNHLDLTASVAAGTHGIYLASATSQRIKIEGNFIRGATGHGIYGLAAMTDIDVLNNTLTDNTSGLRADSAATRWHVIGNRVFGNAEWGIAFAVASTDLSIASNASYSNPSGNYYTTGSTFLTHVINGAGG